MMMILLIVLHCNMVNKKYIDLVENEIIKRDWLEVQALENALGKNSPYKELHQNKLQYSNKSLKK